MSSLANLEKLLETSSLTVLEAVELSRLLEEKWGVSAASALPLDTDDLGPAEWVVADLIALKAEATALAKSLDETRNHVRARCREIMAA